jgi:hypothetical protein
MILHVLIDTCDVLLNLKCVELMCADESILVIVSEECTVFIFWVENTVFTFL